MGAVTTIAIGLAGAGLSFYQAKELEAANVRANELAAENMERLKKQANVNVMDELSLNTEVFERELENNLQVSADFINAAQEGGARELAASAGKIGAIQTAQAETSRLAQMDELNRIEALQLAEQGDINQQLLAMDVALLQDTAGRDAQTRQAVASANASGVAALGSALTSVASNSSLNSLSKDDRKLQKLYKDNKLLLDSKGISEIDFYKNPKLLQNLTQVSTGVEELGSLSAYAASQEVAPEPVVGTAESATMTYDEVSQQRRADEFAQSVLNESTDNRSQADIDLDNYINSFPQAPSITGDGSFNQYNIVPQDRLFVNNNRIQMPNRTGFNSNPQSIFEKYGLTLNR